MRMRNGENPHIIDEMMEDGELNRQSIRDYEKFITDKTRHYDKQLIIDGYESILEH